MNAQKLRDGWKIVKFGDVVRNVNETSRNPDAEGIDRVVGLDHIDPESLPLRRWDELAALPDGTSFTRKFQAGQVLFGKRRAYQRKVAVPDFDGICSSDILVFETADQAILPEFLPYLVQSEGFFNHALGTSAGSLSPRTKWAELAKYEFALPPLDEQRRIVEVLRAGDVVADRYSSALLAVTAWERSYFNWLVLEMPRVRLGDVADVDLGRQRAPKYDSGPNMLPYIRAGNVKHGQLMLEDVLAMNFSVKEQKYLALRAGDVLVTEGCGSLKEIGANAVWSGELPGDVCFQNTVLRLRQKSPVLDQRFLAGWASAAFHAGEFAAIASGTSIYHLGAKRTADVQIPLPDRQTQEAVVNHLEAASKLKAELHQAASRQAAARKVLIESMLNGRGLDVQ